MAATQTPAHASHSPPPHQEGPPECSESTMQVKTARFGTVEVDDALVITFPKGILGFSEDSEYCLLNPNEEGAFYWLQSTQTPELAFVVTNPNAFVPEYDVPIRQDQADELRIEDPASAQVLVIVNKIGETLTANLQGPIVVNADARIAQQLVLAERRWTTRHPIMNLEADSTNAAATEQKSAQRIPA